MEHGVFIQWELLLGVGVPAVIITGGVLGYLIKFTKCISILQQKVSELTSHDVGSESEHDDLWDEVSSIKKNLYLIMGAMKIKPVD